MIWKSIKIFWQPWGCRGCPHQKNCVCLLLFDQKRPKAVVRPWLMLQKIYFMVFERYIPELKKYDSISFLHQPMTSGQPLKIVQRHMAHPVYFKILGLWSWPGSNNLLCGCQYWQFVSFFWIFASICTIFSEFLYQFVQIFQNSRFVVKVKPLPFAVWLRILIMMMTILKKEQLIFLLETI